MTFFVLNVRGPADSKSGVYPGILRHLSMGAINRPHKASVDVLKLLLVVGGTAGITPESHSGGSRSYRVSIVGKYLFLNSTDYIP